MIISEYFLCVSVSKCDKSPLFLLKHTLQRNLPLLVDLIFPMLGVPTVDGPSQLRRYKGQTALKRFVRRGTSNYNFCLIIICFKSILLRWTLSPFPFCGCFLGRRQTEKKQTWGGRGKWKWGWRRGRSRCWGRWCWWGGRWGRGADWEQLEHHAVSTPNRLLSEILSNDCVR